MPAIGGQLSFSALGADGQVAVIGLFHAGVLIAAGNSVDAFHVQIDVALALGFDRGITGGSTDIDVLDGHIGGGTVIRLDGDGVLGLRPIAGDGGVAVLCAASSLRDGLGRAALGICGGGDLNAAVFQIPFRGQNRRGQKCRDQQQRRNSNDQFTHMVSS